MVNNRKNTSEITPAWVADIKECFTSMQREITMLSLQ